MTGRANPIRATIAILGALALCSCGGSTKTVTASGTAPSSGPATAGATSSVTTPAAPSNTATGSAAAPGRAIPLCTAAGLALSFVGQQGATGHGELGFALRNTSGRSCHTFGYPGVLFLTRSGQALATASTRTTHDFFGVAPAVALVVAPDAGVSFRLGVTHFGAGGSDAGCATAYALQAIPPDDTHTLRVAIPQGAYECGTATVSPLRPGSSAYP